MTRMSGCCWIWRSPTLSTRRRCIPSGRRMTDCDADHPESGPHQHEHPGEADEHGHGVTASSDSRYIAIALGLIVCFLVFEVIMAFVGHSLALLADAGHMLTDAGALGASLVAVRLARRPASG